MIVRVDIENLVIVEHAEFVPGAGLTAITGETGAGKTLLATAIALLFGGDADAGQVGPASEQAWIEGEFEVDDAFWLHPDVATLAELRPEDDTPLVLARRVERSGRSRAMAWGRTVAKTDLAAAGRLLVATAGQHVQVRLRSPEHQRMTLDGAGGIAQSLLVTEMHAAWAALTAARVEHARVDQLVAVSALHAGRLREDLARIEPVQPSAADAGELRGARDRARHHATLVESLAGAASTLEGRDGASAVDLVGRAYASLQHGAELDPGLHDLAGQLLALQEQLADAASDIGSRLSELEGGPASLDDIEERLSAYAELERHFGGTVESVLAAWADLRVQVASIDDAGGALGETQARVAVAETAARGVAQRLTDARCLLADQLSADVRDSLAELGMGGSVFRVDVGEHELGLHGGDRIAFLLAPSEGIEPRRVAQVASGGELSRIALALLVATST
ncbi:MAG: AAA family ATPase, partial [Thermoleophilia bacterium]|nr:AAA family ATPase [Thermoleophilia bacterium]